MTVKVIEDLSYAIEYNCDGERDFMIGFENISLQFGCWLILYFNRKSSIILAGIRMLVGEPSVFKSSISIDVLIRDDNAVDPLSLHSILQIEFEMFNKTFQEYLVACKEQREQETKTQI